ncbi:autotransporter domain-containing protein [Rhodanobacter sp. 115]|uniref:autotransporter domain-containing protein n=2 Tax=Rhodanobacter sp. FW021-MT20 TaxID=1162282 RepID=UPI0034E451BF
MNRTYRLVWNRALRVMQVASELAMPPRHGTAAATTSRLSRRLLAVACAVALSASLAPLQVWATVGGSQGGAGGAGSGAYGGSGGNGNGGGGQGGSGWAGVAGSNGNGGAGGHGGSAISAGGNGGSVGATTMGNTPVTGGNGTDGQTDPGTSFMSGGGGGGGDGVYTADTGITVGAGLAITGGHGGNAGNGDRIGGGGGAGGAGLATLTDAAVLTNAGNITGGNGGNGGSGQWSGGGGGGGDGILVSGASGNLTNSGSIAGGAGGASGGITSFSGVAGEGGAGIDLAGDGTLVTNSGSIAGGDAHTAAGAGITGGNGSHVTNLAGGSIAGGDTLDNYTIGGSGIAAVTSGAQTFIIDNAGTLRGGIGANATGGFNGNGTGGDGIQATGNVTIGNSGLIEGGHGGSNNGGGHGGTGIAIAVASGEQATVTNRSGGVIRGGYGGVVGSGNLGGTGIDASGNVSIVNQSGAAILGDDGGLSDISTSGGTAIAATSGASIDNSGTIAGTGGIIAGTAIRVHDIAAPDDSTGATVIVNRAGGTIQGGNGQDANTGAAAIVASGQTSIDNSGSLIGGQSSVGGVQADAVVLSGGGNTLLLRAGSSITGNVVSNSGSGVGGDSFILGGDDNAIGGNTFDTGTATGFASYQKSGASTWTLTGIGSTAQDWSIAAGTLVGDSTSLAGNIDDAAALVFNQAADGSFGGIVSGTGSLAKTGTGTLVLTGANTYGGGTTIDAGTLSVSSDGNLGDSAGAVDIDNATLQAGASFASARAFSLTNYAHIDTQGFDLTLSGPITTSGYGILFKDGTGTLTVTGQANAYQGTIIDCGTLALSGDGAISGTLDIQGGATLDISQTRAGASIGTLGGNGTVALGGQTLTVNLGASNWSFDGTLDDGGIGGGTGGSMVLDDDLGIATFTGVNGYTGSTTIAAGTLALTGTGSIAASSGLIDNGTFDIAGTRGGASVASLGGSGAVTLGSQTLTLSRAHDSFDGVIAGSGGLLFDGGRQVLNGANTYTGLTDVHGGTLIVGDDAHASAAIAGSAQVENGATLGGHGRIGGDVTVQSGGHLAPGASIGTLTVGGNLVAASGSVLDYEFGAPGADLHTFGTGDNVKVDGNLELDGAVLNVADAGGMGPGLYNVFRWGGSLIETNGGVALGSTPTGSLLQLQTLSADRQINLIATTGLTLNIWNANGQATASHMGGGSGTWTTTAPVWTDAQADVTSAMQPQPGFAIFGGTAGTVTVDNGAGTVSATGLQFASDGYTLTGDTLTLVGAGGSAPVIRVGDGSGAGTGMTATIGNVLAGSAGLTKTDLGTLVLGGANTYTGGTFVDGGTLSVSGDGNLGAASGGLTLDGGTLRVTGTAFRSTARTLTLGSAGGGFDIADAGNTFTVDQALSGSGSLTKRGTGTLLLTGANTYTGGTVVEAGTLAGDTASLRGAIADNATLSIAQASDSSFDGTLSGHGTLLKSGAGTLTVNGTNPFAGTTTVQAGSLVVGDDSHASATLGGTVTVTAGATLGGIGTLGGLDLAGTLSPGNSVGTLHVSGNATLEQGASMRIDATPDGHADQLAVGGKVDILGGSALVLAQPGNWAPRTDYTIVTAAGGVSGQFTSASTSLAFLMPVLSYTANAVNLSLQRNDIGFADVGHTPNQKAAAHGAESLGWGTPVYDALVKLDAPQARHAFDQLSGEIYPGTLAALAEDDRYVRDAINRHLLGLGEGTEGRTADGTDAWLSGWGHWGRDDGDGNAASLRANGSGLLLGVDRTVGMDSRLGLLLGHGQNSLDVDQRASSAHVRSRQLGVYGDTSFGALQLRAAAIHAWQDVDTQRTAAFPGFDERLASRRHVRSDQAYVEAGYRLTLPHGQQLEPFVNLAHTQLHAGAVRESNGQAALVVAAADPSVSSATLGLRDTFTSKAGLHLHASLAWQQGWGDLTPVATMRFTAGGDSFAVAGVPLARHALLANLGTDFPLARNVTLDVSYLGQFATRYRDQGARLSLSVAF